MGALFCHYLYRVELFYGGAAKGDFGSRSEQQLLGALKIVGNEEYELADEEGAARSISSLIVPLHYVGFPPTTT